MNFKQLEAFYWLSKLENYQRVAQHIGLTQPAISARIAGLEETLGEKLVDRSAPEFRLTDQGCAVAEFAESFLNLREAMTSRLQQKTQRHIGIAMVGPAAFTWGQTLRKRLEEISGKVVADFHVGSNHQIRQFIRSGAIDIGFLSNEAGLPQLPGRFAVRYHVGWVARPDVVGMLEAPLAPAQLRNLPLILYPRTSPLFSPVADYVEETQDRPDARHFANSLATIMEMLRAGYGASAIPLASVEADIASGRLVEIPATEPLPPLDIRCVHANPARRALVEEIMGLAHAAAVEWCGAHPRYMSLLAE